MKLVSGFAWNDVGWGWDFSPLDCAFLGTVSGQYHCNELANKKKNKRVGLEKENLYGALIKSKFAASKINEKGSMKLHDNAKYDALSSLDVIFI